MNTRCRKCGFSLYKSKYRWFDYLAMLFFVRPVRCENCGRRYYLPLVADVRDP